MPALAFLSPLKFPAAFNELRGIMPPEANEIVNYFDEIYGNGRIKIQVIDVIKRLPPLFPPDIWSVYENNEFGFARTQNNVEAWHRLWQDLIERSHVQFNSVFSIKLS